MLENLASSHPNAAVILSLAVMLFSGFLLTRLTKKLKLPNVTGYLFAGILIGPYVLGLVPSSVVGGHDFVTDAALAFIAFGVGKYFKLSALRRSGWGIVVITLLEALMAALLITLTMIGVFHLSVSFSLLLGAIGCATAPASTIMTIRQYKAKGPFVDTILQVVALDDAVALIAFSVCAAIAQSLNASGRMDARGRRPAAGDQYPGGGGGRGPRLPAQMADKRAAVAGAPLGAGRRRADGPDRSVHSVRRLPAAVLHGAGHGLCQLRREQKPVQAGQPLHPAHPAALFRAVRPAAEHSLPPDPAG